MGGLGSVPPVVGHRYRMRDGYEAVVTGCDGEEPFPFIGTAGGEPWSWTAEGWALHGVPGCRRDLVEDLGVARSA